MVSWADSHDCKRVSCSLATRLNFYKKKVETRCLDAQAEKTNPCWRLDCKIDYFMILVFVLIVLLRDRTSSFSFTAVHVNELSANRPRYSLSHFGACAQHHRRGCPLCSRHRLSEAQHVAVSFEFQAPALPLVVLSTEDSDLGIAFACRCRGFAMPRGRGGVLSFSIHRLGSCSSCVWGQVHTVQKKYQALVIVLSEYHGPCSVPTTFLWKQ